MKPQKLIVALGVAGTLLFPAVAGANDEGQDTSAHHQSAQQSGNAQDGIVVVFDADSAELTDEAKQNLDETAAWLKKNRKRKIAITPDTTWTASADYSDDMALQRSQAVKDYLAQKTKGGARRVAIVDSDQPLEPNPNVAILYVSSQGAGQQSAEIGMDGTGESPAEAAIEEAQAESAEPVVEMGYVAVVPEGEAYPEATTGAEVEVAEPEVQVETPDVDVTTTDTSQQRYVWKEEPSHLVTPAGLGISIGGGVYSFIDGETNDFTTTGGSWEARLAYGTRSFVAVEAAYVGTAQDVDALGLSDGAALVSNGAEGLLRLNLTRTSIQPYLFGGFGWSYFRVVGEDFNVSAIESSDNVFQVPMGIGLGFRSNGFLLDIRGTYRYAFDDDMFQGQAALTGDDDADMDSWNAIARLGWEL